MDLIARIGKKPEWNDIYGCNASASPSDEFVRVFDEFICRYHGP